MGKKSLVHKKRVIFTPSAKFHGMVIFYPKTNSKFPWQQSFCLYALFVFGPENSKLCISPGDAIFFPSGCAFCILSIVRDQHGRVCVSMGFNPMDRPNRSTFLMENHGLFKPARLITGRVIIAHSIPSEIYIRNKVIFFPLMPLALPLPLPLPSPSPLPLLVFGSFGSGHSSPFCAFFSLRTALLCSFLCLESLPFFSRKDPKWENPAPNWIWFFSWNIPPGSNFRNFSKNRV